MSQLVAKIKDSGVISKVGGAAGGVMSGPVGSTITTKGQELISKITGDNGSVNGDHEEDNISTNNSDNEQEQLNDLKNETTHEESTSEEDKNDHEEAENKGNSENGESKDGDSESSEEESTDNTDSDDDSFD